MSEQTMSLGTVVFAYAPFFALFAFLGAWLYRWGILGNDAGPQVAQVSPVAETSLAIGFVVLAGGHLVALVAPGAMKALLGDLVRVAVIECVGLVAALLFAWGVGARLVVRVRAWRAGVRDQAPRVLVLALLFATCCSGVLLTVGYRWLVAWYAYIQAPYLRSLFIMEPDTASIVASPWPIKLHALLFMMLVAAWPLGGLSWEEVLPLKAIARRFALGHDATPAGGAEGVAQ